MCPLGVGERQRCRKRTSSSFLSEHLDTVPCYFLSWSLSSSAPHLFSIWGGNSIYLQLPVEDCGELPMALAGFWEVTADLDLPGCHNHRPLPPGALTQAVSMGGSLPPLWPVPPALLVPSAILVTPGGALPRRFGAPHPPCLVSSPGAGVLLGEVQSRVMFACSSSCFLGFCFLASV